MTPPEMCKELGITRQTLMMTERRALEKMRALIAGTDDFPELRHEFLPRLEKMIGRDVGAGEERRAKWVRENTRRTK